MASNIDPKLAGLSELVAGCLPTLRSKEFGGALIEGLRGLVTIDDATVLYYARGELPSLVYRESPINRGEDTMERYLAGAFLLDPFYKAVSEHKRFGLFRLRELAPPRFRDSEYFRNWYSNCGFTDECGFLIDLGREGFVNVALGRIQNRRFTDGQVRSLRSVRAAVEALCREQWRDRRAPGDRPAEGDGLRRQMHSALEHFGSSLLTDRETQVINLVLHGHSTKSIAERLGISVETVKLHRKHAYAKLEVGSQAELFYLFLDSLMSASDYQGGDTLVSYMQRPAAGS